MTAGIAWEDPKMEPRMTTDLLPPLPFTKCDREEDMLKAYREHSKNGCVIRAK